MTVKKPSSPKIIDVAAPDQTSPDPSSRPVVVTNRPVLTNDPMMAASTDSGETANLATAPVVSRQAKTITPSAEVGEATPAAASVEPDLPVDVTEAPTAEPETKISQPAAPAAEVTQTEPATVETDTPKDTLPPEPPVQEATPPSQPAPSYEQTASAKAADDERVLGEAEARRQELERLIQFGKYAVPINAVQRKRSRVVIFLLCLLALVLAAALFDLALDSNLISMPGVPHTHFFQGQ